MTDLSDALGVVILIVSLCIGAFALYFLRARARLEAIQGAFAQVTLVPERRRRFLLILLVESACFLLTGLLFGLSNLGIPVSSDPDLLYSVTFLVGMAALGVLMWVGLTPRVLTKKERKDAGRDASTVMQSIWMMPYHSDEEEQRMLRER